MHERVAGRGAGLELARREWKDAGSSATWG